MMMKPVRLYDRPEAFAEMVVRQVKSSINVHIVQKEEDPLLLEINVGSEEEKEMAQVSLHSTFLTYIRSGDLNTAVDYLNGIIHCSTELQNKAALEPIDPACLYPALRDSLFVKEAARGMELLTEEILPGLHVVYLELKQGYSKMINRSLLESQPRWTEERIRRVAYRNLKSEGWTPPNLSLPSPFRQSCTVDVFLDNPFPSECQLLVPELYEGHIPGCCVFAFPNRRTTLLMRSEERMETASEALRLVQKSRFNDVVRRSYRLMPHPVSERIYFSRKGKVVQLEIKQP
ncbi:DUF1444 family protein [Paenibacillus sp.]|uniref:DUF1444 family protein n=1 Tax=Paenibacillus sp. TaxID=58172 RepID=UPI002D7EF6ED|nr:DUF1444 family protein [Paenibacillus sp.]